MLEEQGRVVAVDGDEAWVQTIRESTCNACSAQKGCGQKLLNSWSAGQAFQVKVTNHLGVQVGDEVVLGVPESALLKASVVQYLLPLLTMMLGAAVCRWQVSNSDGWLILGGFLGLAAGFFGARWFSDRRQGDGDFHPRLLRRFNSASAIASDRVSIQQP